MFVRKSLSQNPLALGEGRVRASQLWSQQHVCRRLASIGISPKPRVATTLTNAHGPIWLAIALSVAGAAFAAAEPAVQNWHVSQEFGEQWFTVQDERQLRFHVNAMRDQANSAVRPARLIIYALPNGNTIEQTLGCRPAEGLDWHYDIQHVMAQVRLLRSLRPDERIVLVCAEAAGLSWPRWRENQPDANATIGRLVDEWRQQFGGENSKVTLTGHSGGGSFMFGLIEAHDEIPAFVDRIAFLDANYSFAGERHAEKLAQWLTGNVARRLIVIAYDDREIVFEGKKVVGPTGGTFRATGRMHAALGKPFPLVDSEQPPFLVTTGLDGRIYFYVHPNPENKILHTALVGEMNGLVHAETLGTPQEGQWGTFGGPRAYTRWIQTEPTPNDTEQDAPGATDSTNNGSGAAGSARFVAEPNVLHLPLRSEDAIGGPAFVEQVKSLPFDDREAAIFREITSGNFPHILRSFKTVRIRGMIRLPGDVEPLDREATLRVMPDYLAIGSDTDFVRMPMTPQTAQRIADRFGCLLPTRKIVDAIDQQAELHLEPRPLTNEREAVTTFQQHHEIIEEQRAGKPLGLLTIGIKKDIVLSPRIYERPQRLAIYGWRQLDGEPIQPLTIVHWNRYVDYSHGVRLVANAIEIDGQRLRITDLLRDPDRCGLVSDEGPIDPPEYPLD